MADDTATASPDAGKEAPWSFDLDEMRQHLKNDDDLQALVLRGHIYVEYVLIEFLKHALPKHQLLTIDRMNFLTKAEVCAALGALQEDYRLSDLDHLRPRLLRREDLSMPSEAIYLPARWQHCRNKSHARSAFA